MLGPMYRPTRKTQNLEKKLAAKQTRSRKVGAKAKRWKKALEGAKAPSES
ncbi:MAG: hypothetical protein FJ095_09585 [Deltaproteobacteria bacterium]|nr:hypothetical protein [Deltaproteobacteria bacterium]